MGNKHEKGILELITKAKAGDKLAQSQLVERNLGLVWSIVKRFSGRGFECDDLFQIGCIGLIKAIKKFDPAYNVKFSTYAVPMIIGEIKRFIRDDGMVKVSRGLKEMANKVKITKDVMTKELGREPLLNEIAERLRVDMEEVVMALEANNTPESLYDKMYEDNDEILVIDRIEDQSNRLEVDDKIVLKQLLENMSFRERQIIILRYFEEKTQSQVATMLGISQVQVSRLEKKILNILKEKMLS